MQWNEDFLFTYNKHNFIFAKMNSAEERVKSQIAARTSLQSIHMNTSCSDYILFAHSVPAIMAEAKQSVNDSRIRIIHNKSEREKKKKKRKKGRKCALRANEMRDKNEC